MTYRPRGMLQREYAAERREGGNCRRNFRYDGRMDRSAALASITFTLAIAFASPQTSAQGPEKDWRQVCARSTAAPVKIPAFAHVEAEIDLQHCDSTSLYYGFGRPADWTAALQCAWYQRSHPRPGDGDPFSGPGVLTMLYANGHGVARNYDRAIRFACEDTWAADTEMEFRIGHLEQLRDTQGATPGFDLCDDGTSGLMMGACESIRQRLSDVGRLKELDRISARWPPRVKEAFKSLTAAEEAFAAARSGNEVDRSGSGREAFSLKEEGRLRDQFLTNLRRFSRGDVPSASLSINQSRDRELNETYQKIEQSPDSLWNSGTIKPAGIRETERAWLSLRDAWVAFARMAYPRRSADTVRTQITRLRLQQLQALQPR